MTRRFLLFTLDGRRFAVPLEALRRVVRMVEITPLPGAPDPVCGMINVQGEAVPVFDLRRLWGMPPAPPSPDDHLVLASAGEGTVALRADAAEDVEALSGDRSVSLEGLISEEMPAEGVAPVAEDLVVLVDPGRLLARARAAVEVVGDEAT